VAFYERLGFEGGAHAADAHYAILSRGTVELHFFAFAALVPQDSFAGCYVRVAAVDSFFKTCSRAQLPTAGIPRITSLEDKPWGMREFAVVDIDGNLLRIGQVLEG
jgi:catechol 2,3-dioxygenase-like lactoylglutathione lyase family enzyme